MRFAAALSRALPAAAIVAMLGLGLGGCASGPASSERAAPRRAPPPADDRGSPERDGPGANPPADLDRLPDAEPRVEPVRPGGANKPYQALGRDYVPLPADSPLAERGLASWYGRKFHGRRTASGEPYDMYAMTAAHPTLPIPSYARVKNPANGREVIVRINDRGPFHPGRIVDLSYAAAARLDLLRGVAPVELQRITWDEIRAGTWRRGAPPTDGVAATTSASTVPVPVPLAEAVVAAAPMPAPVPAADPAPDPPPVAAPVAPSVASPAAGFWVQIGAFRDASGAESFQRRVGAEVESIAALLATFADASLYRVQAGPYPRRSDAVDAAARIRAAIGVVPMVVEKTAAR